MHLQSQAKSLGACKRIKTKSEMEFHLQCIVSNSGSYILLNNQRNIFESMTDIFG